jgi:hypothetical protein
MALVLAIGAAILAIVGIIESRGRNWAAWGVLCLAALHLLGSLT